MAGRTRGPLAALKDDRGGMTAWMLIWVVGITAIGGLAVDTSKAWRMKTMLRAAADASSHAALHAAVTGGDPIAAAQRYVELNLPHELMGEVLRATDVELGAWNEMTGDFVVDEASLDAVRVTVFRAARNANAEPTTLLNIIGIHSWDLSMRIVASTYDAFGNAPDAGDTCLTKGIVARGTVSVTSNNTFSDVCVHGEEGFTFLNGNLYEAGAQISMPDLATRLNHGQPFNAKQNTGIYAALVQQSIDPILVDKTDGLTLYFALGAQVMSVDDYDASLLNDGDHIYVHCDARGKLTLPALRIRDLILTTNCAVDLAIGGDFVNTVIATSMNAGGDDETFAAFDGATEMTARMAHALLVAGKAADAADPTLNDGIAMTGAAGVLFGEQDSCADGGGSIMVADGKIRIAAKMGIYGSTIIASGDIDWAAQTAGVEGMSIQSGGDVDLPAQQTFIGCNGTDWRIDVKQKVRFMN